MLCSDFRAVRKNDPLLPNAGCRETITSKRGISDAPPDERNPDGVNWLPAAHFVLNFRDPALPSPREMMHTNYRASL